jgi:cytochrome c553
MLWKRCPIASRRAFSRDCGGGLRMFLPCLLLVACIACREDMQNQPRLKPMRPSGFLGEDRPGAPLPGTISRDEPEGAYFYTGYNGTVVGNRIPFPVNRAVLERGRERFDIYCAPCHSRSGDGNGMIVQRGYRRPPSYHTDRLRNAPLGHFFEVITNGFGAMPDYSAQIEPRDRWAIAAYIRALQFSQNAPATLLPTGTSLPPPPPMPGTPGSGAASVQTEPESGNLPAAESPPSALQKKAATEQQKQEQREREVQHK